MRLLILLSLFIVACGDNAPDEKFDRPTLVAVDSTNDRLFVLEKEGVLSILTASDREEIGDQPFVDKDHEETIHDLLPSSPIHLDVVASGSTSRLFITGSEQDSDGNAVFNQILALDFDGTTLSAASFSPIAFSDGDDATTESDNMPGGLLADSDNDRLYVTDATGGRLYIFSTETGAEAAASLAIAGNPNRMGLADGRLYVANATDTDADQVVTVVNTTDFSTTTIDLDAATDGIAAASNASGTVILARQANGRGVLIRTVDTTTFASVSAVPVSDSSAESGQLTSGAGISSLAGDVLLAESDGVLFGYAPQTDGKITRIDFAADLSSFTAETLSTATKILAGGDLYSSGGDDITLFMAARGTGDLVFTDIGSEEVGATF
ncbi:MAG: hypothetical protein Q7T11_09355 [Deltaproteobacteria bacterium]|nr:hypothetical protein [Deltaproteobacteria bacterium]